MSRTEASRHSRRVTAHHKVLVVLGWGCLLLPVLLVVCGLLMGFGCVGAHTVVLWGPLVLIVVLGVAAAALAPPQSAPSTLTGLPEQVKDDISAWAAMRVGTGHSADQLAGKLRSIRNARPGSLPSLDVVQAYPSTAAALVDALPGIGSELQPGEVIEAVLTLRDNFPGSRPLGALAITNSRVIHSQVRNRNAFVRRDIQGCLRPDNIPLVWFGIAGSTAGGFMPVTGTWGGELPGAGWPVGFIEELPRLYSSTDGLRRACPRCAEHIVLDASVCPFCGNELPGAPRITPVEN